MQAPAARQRLGKMTFANLSCQGAKSREQPQGSVPRNTNQTYSLKYANEFTNLRCC